MDYKTEEEINKQADEIVSPKRRNRYTRQGFNDHEIRDGLVYIQLTKDKVCVIDVDDLDKVNMYRWFTHIKGEYYYAATHDFIEHNKYIYMHHLIFEKQDGLIIAHVNKDGLDNRKENLLYRTIRENNNLRRLQDRNKTGYRGVLKHRSGKFCANCKGEYLGTFETAEEASAAYWKKKLGE